IFDATNNKFNEIDTGGPTTTSIVDRGGLSGFSITATSGLSVGTDPTAAIAVDDIAKDTGGPVLYLAYTVATLSSPPEIEIAAANAPSLSTGWLTPKRLSELTLTPMVNLLNTFAPALSMDGQSNVLDLAFLQFDSTTTPTATSDLNAHIMRFVATDLGKVAF